MEAIILIGIQGAGKSTFCKQRLFDTHVRINLDMLRTRNREETLLSACLEAKQQFVVDNTNATLDERSMYIRRARSDGFRVIGYYFASRVEECKQRNEARQPKQVVPLKGLLGTYGRLQLPTRQEGFDELYYVEIDRHGGFLVSEWRDEV